MREERPEQEDLTIPDHDRTLWQMRQHRADSAEAWAAWVREQSPERLHQLDRAMVRMAESRVSRLPRNWPQNNQETGQEGEGGDS